MTSNVQPEDIIEFWHQAGRSAWFNKDDAFDQQIKDKFKHLPDAIKEGEYEQWLTTPEGMLALILCLDQFPRNMYRATAHSFAYDELAKDLAKKTITKKWDEAIKQPLKRFIYLPFMHSEKLEDQHKCVELCAKANDPEGVDYSKKHLEVILRFGRFPHRNECLGRVSTPQEIAYINSPGSGF